jgi:hypothetical protein
MDGLRRATRAMLATDQFIPIWNLQKMGCVHYSGAAEMRRVVTPRKAIGFIAPLAMSLFGLGCVNLDKPTDVAACAANNTCSNGGEKNDAAVPKDDAGGDGESMRDSAAPPTDARVEGDAASTFDDVSADRADAGQAESADAVAGTPGDVADAGKPDSRVGDDTVADATPSPDLPPVADVAKDTLGPDMADAAVADTNPPPMDTGPNNVVTFNLGKGVGAMTGYGWAAPGAADSISSPTCAAGTPITSAAPCLSQTNWGTTYPGYPNALCVSGSIPSTTTSPDTSANWGIQVGVNAADPDNAGIGRPFTTVAVNASGVPSGDVRIEIHRRGDDPGVTYCAAWTNGATPVVLTSFNTDCWDLTGTRGIKLTAADVPTIDKVGLQVSPSKTSAITLTNLCMRSITFGN